jgi:hypothetical protein
MTWSAVSDVTSFRGAIGFLIGASGDRDKSPSRTVD